MAARLGAECRERREAAGLRQIDIATCAGVDETTIGRFERTTERWAWNTDRIVAAYAAETGTTERALWQAAIDRG